MMLEHSLRLSLIASGLESETLMGRPERAGRTLHGFPAFGARFGGFCAGETMKGLGGSADQGVLLGSSGLQRGPWPSWVWPGWGPGPTNATLTERCRPSGEPI